MTSLHWILSVATLVGVAFGFEKRNDVCQSQAFSAECWPDEAILMLDATYGRMKIGSCVTSNLGGVIGCSKDVLGLTDRWCSGRRTCKFQVPNAQLDKTEPCHKELKTYLQAAFTCVKVAIAEPTSCSSGSHVRLAPPEGHISSEITDETGCGTRMAPWVMDTMSGQTVNVTLFNLGFKGLRDGYESRPFGSGTCHQIGYIVEMNPPRNQTICAGKEREELIFTSKSNRVEIVVLNEKERHGFIYMLRYQIIGCADLKPPPHAWYKREGDQAIVGCETMEKSWHLTCVGNKWKGVVGNCTVSRLAPSINAVTRRSFLLSKELSVVIVLSLALLVALLILATGFVCIVRRKRSEYAKAANVQMSSPVSLPPDGSTKPLYPVFRDGGDALHSDMSSEAGNEYAHTTQNMSTFSDSDYESQSSLPFAKKNPHHDGYCSRNRGTISIGSNASYSGTGPRYFVLDRDVLSSDGPGSRQDAV